MESTLGKCVKLRGGGGSALPRVPRLNHFESSHSASLKIRLNVSWIQEGDAHEEARPREGPQLPQAECALQVGVKGGDVGALACPALNPSELISPRLSSPVLSFPPFLELPPWGGGHGVGGSSRIC